MRRLTLIISLLIAGEFYAQHCPFDNRGLLVVKVETLTDNYQTDVLQPILTYLDSNNNQIRTEFIQNRNQTIDFLWKKYKTTTSLHFDFAKNYFVAEISMDKIQNIIIHLEDEKGNIAGEKCFVKNKDIFDLHKNYGHNWSKFSENFTPKPINPFQQLITIKIDNIEITKGTLFEKIGTKIFKKYKYKSTVIFDNQKDLDEVIKIIPYRKIDFSKKIVIYQHFRGDCHMRVKLYTITNLKGKTITIKSFNRYGGCRASGKVVRLSIIDKPTVGFKLLFEDVQYEDFDYLNY